jgi:hypothetical protein
MFSFIPREIIVQHTYLAGDVDPSSDIKTHTQNKGIGSYQLLKLIKSVSAVLYNRVRVKLNG